MQPRTKRQKEVLDYLTQFVDRNGYEPSYQQIARQLGVRSKGGIQRHIEALEVQGLISRRRLNGSFGIDLCPNSQDPESGVSVELIRLDNTFREISRSPLMVPDLMLGDLSGVEHIAVTVVDDSLLDAHICEEDIVLLEKRNYARRGQIVLISVNGELRLGRYHSKGTEIELRPANAAFETLILPADEVEILGVMRGLLRSQGSQQH